MRALAAGMTRNKREGEQSPFFFYFTGRRDYKYA
nr:MAG TPA: hypothetical protein [Caudoviricetes sp.]